ncbi:peroxiredoxin [Pelagicoccus mobilis]|uniref:thioredoxin-dependent peroxiredoxin n=1 Tax=Pelagicoccus mobilis TaxID=415221 RepID=A0A934RX89_9BACT|nr:peroxiredoxin [Pelagicoccus mobilis]MBK1876899.1 peroxiredoxin [Pelagicoccus mobilis]
MGLSVGDIAPDFCLESSGGGVVSSNDLRGQCFVLYFYPKDFTSVCTAEACSFRDQFADLRDLDVTVFGVSRDDLDTHRKFKEEYDLPFELLSDPDGKTAKAYGARVPLLGVTKRVTYLVNGEGRIAAVHEEMFGDASHVNAVLSALSKGEVR